MFITEKKLLKWALYSHGIYIVLLVLLKPKGFNVSKVVITSFLIFSVIAIGFLCIKNFKLLRKIPKTANFILFFLILWATVITIRSFSSSIQDWMTNFGNVHMALAWFTPIVIIIGQKIQYWTIVFKAINFMFSLIFIAFLFHLLGLGSITQEWTWLLRPIAFIFLITFYALKYISKLKMLLALMLYITIALMVKLRFEFLFLFIVFLFLLLDNISSIKEKRGLLKYILIGFIISLTWIFTLGYESIERLISSIIEYQDSRTFLFNELFQDLNTSERYFGRGTLGTYYSDFFEKTRRYYEIHNKLTWAGDVPDRITIEVGYLQMILKGGYLMLFLYSSIGFYATYLAIFKSNNKFIRRLGFYTLIILILSIVSLRPSFTPIFLIFWMAIGTVLNKKYRMMQDIEVNKLIKF